LIFSGVVSKELRIKVKIRVMFIVGNGVKVKMGVMFRISMIIVV
jgi:hypothetical protein